MLEEAIIDATALKEASQWSPADETN